MSRKCGYYSRLSMNPMKFGTVAIPTINKKGSFRAPLLAIQHFVLKEYSGHFPIPEVRMFQCSSWYRL